MLHLATPYIGCQEVDQGDQTAHFSDNCQVNALTQIANVYTDSFAGRMVASVHPVANLENGAEEGPPAGANKDRMTKERKAFKVFIALRVTVFLCWVLQSVLAI